MIKDSYPSGFESILYSIGVKPLQDWFMEVRNGHIKRVIDADMQSSVLEIAGANVSQNYISYPSDEKKQLKIPMPYLVFQVKYLKKYFTFEVTIMDDKKTKRKFKACNYILNTRVKPSLCTVPMRMEDGWNQIFFNLADFVKRAYGTNYKYTSKVQIHANCRLRRVYFTEHPQNYKKIPPEFKAFASIEEDSMDKKKIIEEEA